jgi:Holliday junction DNA helicase RuvA
MIERLNGEIVEKEPGHVVAMAGGVGYGLDIPLSTYEALGRVGQTVDLFVHTHVREQTLQLFGFATAEERDAFAVLQSVSGVGPGLALTILSGMSIAEFVRAVESGDGLALTTVKGIGKRTAERMILELRDKLKGYAWAAQAAATGKPSARSVLDSHPSARDAMMGLVNLGMKELQAEKAIAAALDALGESASVEELVVEGLRWR